MGVFSFKNDADNLGVLDLVPEQAAAAYSVRKLSKDYNGPAIRVRRSSDNAEQDIYFDGSGNLDISTLLTFTSAADALVTTWYDQSGSGNHATQVTAAYQPKIVDTGSLVLESGKTSLLFDGIDDYLRKTVTLNAPFTFIAINKTNAANPATNATGIIGSNAYGISRNTTFLFRKLALRSPVSNIAIDSTTTPSNDKHLSVGIALDATGIIRVNGSDLTINSGVVSSLSSLTRIDIGLDSGINYFEGYIQEAFVFTSDQYSNLGEIESNINKYYKIY